MKESRPQHLAYAKLKKATFSACEARHAAAAHACAAWSRPIVAVILGLAVWLTAVAVSGGFGAFVGLEQAIVGGPGPGRGALTTAGVAVWYVVGAARDGDVVSEAAAGRVRGGRAKGDGTSGEGASRRSSQG